MTTPTKKSLDAEKLAALEQLQNGEQQSQQVQPAISEENQGNIMDGYILVQQSELPQDGILYPESWKFAHRCPTSKEVAVFSTLNENDHPAILAAIEDLIRKCFIVFDTNKQRQISTGQINDAHRTFFLLKLRDHYLPGNPVKYERIDSFCKETTNTYITAKSLKYAELSEKLLKCFDGRMFTMPYPELEEPIVFLIPTLEITGRIFKYIIRVAQEKEKSGESKGLEDKLIYDKKFLLIAPYLYETGDESMKQIAQKYRAIEQDQDRYKRYVEIATQIKFDNLEEVDSKCEHCGAVESVQLRFPGGWKNMFINKNDTTGYY